MKKIILLLSLILLVGCTGGITGGSIIEDGGKMKVATLETNKGTIKFELYTDGAPITTENFIGLVEKQFYDGLTFHRYVPGFVIQGGDPDGDGTGGSDKSIQLEVSEGLKHKKGAVAMARSQDPNSARSQFYITLEETPSLDGQYAVFGQVKEGMDVVLELREGDKIEKITIN
tara:strand:- start:803 stop:1321 length:519 start_codon:yes stop_codon:yes gene_type:complete